MLGTTTLRRFVSLCALTALLLPACADSTDQQRARAALLRQQGDVGGALRAREDLVSKHPEDPAVLLAYGHQLFEAQHFSEAEAVYRQALQHALAAGHHRAGEAGRSLALVLLRQGKTGEAQALLESALQARPNDQDARIALGLIHLYQGKTSAAQGALRQARAGRPADAAVLYNLGRIALQAGALADAEELFLELGDRHGREPWGPYGLAVVAARRGQPDIACAHLEDARERGLWDAKQVRRDPQFAAANKPNCWPWKGGRS